jgi:hypothetical protein
MFGQVAMVCGVVVTMLAMLAAQTFRPGVFGAMMACISAALNAVLPVNAALSGALILGLAAAVFRLHEGRIARMEVPPEVKSSLWQHTAPRAE